MKDKSVLEEIGAAKKGVSEAENDLARLLSEIQVAPRAEKTTISEAIHDAFQKLRHARDHLEKLEMLLQGKDD